MFLKLIIKYISIFILTILVPFFIWLNIGISIDNLKIKNISINNLFIELEDSKLKLSLETEDNILLYGDVDFSIAHKTIGFNLKSNEFKSLKSILDEFDLNDTIRTWSLDRVKATSYELLSLSGEIQVRSDASLVLVEETLKADLEFNGVDIFFNEKLDPITSDSFILSYLNDSLKFNLKKPIYRNKDLSGSSIEINNLTKDNAALNLTIKMDTRYDHIMKEMLDAYDVKLPITQENGTLDTTFYATIPFSDEANSYIVDITLGSGDLYINSFKLLTKSGKVHYEKDLIRLDNIEVVNDIHGGVVNGHVELENSIADLLYDVKYLNIGEKDNEFFKLDNELLHLKLDYNENTTLEIIDLDSTIVVDSNKTHIKINDINKVKPYIDVINDIVQGGKVDISTKDFEKYDFSGVLTRASCVLYEQEEECKVVIPFKGTKSKDNVNVSIFDNKINYNHKKSFANIKDLNIDLKKVLDLSRKSNSEEEPKVVIVGENSNFRYGDYKLLLDNYDVEVKNGVVKAMGSSNDDIINFYKYKKIVSIEALRVKDKVLHPLINFKGLKDGRYTIKHKGNIDTSMDGTIIIEGGVMKDFKAYNNTLAFINTIPSLVLLQDPGYSSQGFRVTNGIINYKLIEGKKIVFESIYIEGTSANITGVGEIDLEAKTIKLKLAVKVVRDLGSVIGAVPLVGYILLGEDKSLTIGFDISGDLENPEVQISTVEDILALPIRAIERLLKSPAHLLGLDINTQEK